MDIKDLEDSLTEVLHLNGEYLGAEVGRSVNPQRDIKKSCHIMLDLCRYIKQQDEKIRVLNGKIRVLKWKVKKCYTNTAVQDVTDELNETSQ